MLFAMELIAAAFVIIGVVWIIARVGLRPGGGSVQLPPVVDNSIGMWGVREIRARMLGADPDASPSAAVPPVTIVPQPFSAETARRLGIPRAMDLIEPSAGAKSAGRGRSKKAAAAGGAGAGVAAATT